MTKRVGSIVYSTTQGLGILAKDFYDNGVFNQACILEHHCRTNHYDWYPPETVILRKPNGYNLAHEWVKTLDTFLVFETPFDWTLITTAQRHGVKVIFMPMHECSLQHMPCEPDFWIYPSLLEFQVFNRLHRRGVHIPVPVKVEWKLRSTAETFVHNSGHGGLKGRNGTYELLQSFRYLNNHQAKYVIRSQEQLPEFDTNGNNVDVQIGTVERDRLFDMGDVFVFPEKFNGLSLPLQEAFASGMLVIATHRFPMNKWLPNAPLFFPDGYQKSRVGPPYVEFDEALIDPMKIAQMINHWIGKEIQDYSFMGKEYAEKNSWEVLLPKYLEVVQ